MCWRFINSMGFECVWWSSIPCRELPWTAFTCSRLSSALIHERIRCVMQTGKFKQLIHNFAQVTAAFCFASNWQQHVDDERCLLCLATIFNKLSWPLPMMWDLRHHLRVEGAGKVAWDTPHRLASPFYNGHFVSWHPRKHVGERL